MSLPPFASRPPLPALLVWITVTVAVVAFCVKGDVAVERRPHRHPHRAPLPPPPFLPHRDTVHSTSYSDPTQECRDGFGNRCAECCDHECCEDVSNAPAFPETADALGRVYIPVRFVLLTTDSNAEGYTIGDWAVQRQIDVLNWGFRGSKFRFGLRNLTTSAVTWINNTELSNACNTDACYANPLTCPFYAKLIPTLNVDSSQEVVALICSLHYDGESQFPWSTSEGIATGQYIQIRYGAFATKGNGTHRGGGASLIHEMGHYLGLLHTFENGCNPPGDWVSDTPFTAHQADLNLACDSLTKVSTCPGRPPGEAPDQSNFMDYAADDCVDHFTPQQHERMYAAVAKYRPRLLQRAVALATVEQSNHTTTPFSVDDLRRKNAVFVWFLLFVLAYVVLLMCLSNMRSSAYARARLNDAEDLPVSVTTETPSTPVARVVPQWMKYNRSHPKRQGTAGGASSADDA